MNIADSRVRNHFEACVRDLTPARLRHVVHVLHAPVVHDDQVTDLCRSALSDSEVDQSLRKNLPLQLREYPLAEHPAPQLNHRVFQQAHSIRLLAQSMHPGRYPSAHHDLLPGKPAPGY